MVQKQAGVMAVYSWACRTLGPMGPGVLSTGSPSAPSGLAEDKEQRVQAAEGGAHTLTCIPWLLLASQVTQRAQTGKGTWQRARVLVDTHGAATVVRPPAQVCQASPTPPTCSDWGLPAVDAQYCRRPPEKGTEGAQRAGKPRAPPGSPGSRPPQGAGSWEQVRH